MTTVKEVETQIGKQVTAAMNELERAADEVRVKVHLAGMDAKEGWKKLEPQLEDAKQHARSASEAALVAIEDVKKAVRRFAATL